jgi:hypothetical protein
LWNIYGQVLRLNWDLSVGSRNTGDKPCQKKKTGMNDTLDLYVKAIEGNNAQENALFFISPKGPLTNQFHMENKQIAYVFHHMGTQ